MIDYTLVVGVDRHHLEQLKWTWATWVVHKPSLLDHPLVVFYDTDQVSFKDVFKVIRHPRVLYVPWPPEGVRYEGGTDKWSNAQRYRMLAGFVHVPAAVVKTEYWLKLDTDVVAVSGHDDWIDPAWFEDEPAIVAHPWGFTKPANQMDLLDEWVERNRDRLGELAWRKPLALHPEDGSDRICHKRIISWCGFFRTDVTSLASEWAEDACGKGKLPVPSQDGFLWYVATRLDLPVRRAQMKSRGWEHWSSMFNVKAASIRSLRGLLC